MTQETQPPQHTREDELQDRLFEIAHAQGNGQMAREAAGISPEDTQITPDSLPNLDPTLVRRMAQVASSVPSFKPLGDGRNIGPRTKSTQLSHRERRKT